LQQQKKKVRDEFLQNFFLPLRQDYESKIDQYKALFPIKESDMSQEPAEIEEIYAYGEVISTRKVELNPQ
jgi:uncharacterized protein YeeX (DUF496 family)